MFSLDVEVIEFLKGKNASALVNDLMLKHMEQEDYYSMSDEELNRRIEAEKVLEEAKRRANLILNGN